MKISQNVTIKLMKAYLFFNVIFIFVNNLLHFE